jgi:hypothetical protein
LVDSRLNVRRMDPIMECSFKNPHKKRKQSQRLKVKKKFKNQRRKQSLRLNKTIMPLRVNKMHTKTMDEGMASCFRQQR